MSSSQNVPYTSVTVPMTRSFGFGMYRPESGMTDTSGGRSESRPRTLA